MSQKDRREERRSAARRRAENHSSSFETTVLKMPEGAQFFELKAGVITIDVLPYKAGKGNPNAEEGSLYFERTFWQWARVGVEEKAYCCLHKTFGKADPIADWKSAQAKNPEADHELMNNLKPKERQIFLVSEKANPGIKLWEISYYLFGKLLDSRILNSDEEQGWDFFYEPDTTGMSLRLTVEEISQGGYKYLEVVAIDFIPRKTPLPKELVEHGICLDDLLVEKSYDELQKIFLGEGGGPARKDDAKKESSGESASKKSDAPAKKSEDSPKKEEPRKEEPKKSSDFGLSRGDEVVYDKKPCTILKVSADGTSLTLVDSADEIIPNVDPSAVKKMPSDPPKKEELKKDPPKKETKKEEPKDEGGDEDIPEPDPDDDWNF